MACNHCGKAFGRKFALTQHIKEVHDPEVEKYCPGLKPPKRARLLPPTVEEREESLKKSLGEDYKIITYFRCPLCREKFEDKEQFKFDTHFNKSCPKRKYE